MASPVADSYSIASGGNLHAGRNGPPAWLASAVPGTWLELPGTAIGVTGRLDDYSGFSVRQSDAAVYGHGGGHLGSTDNGADILLLSADAPAWQTLITATPGPARTPSDGSAVWFESLPNQKRNVGHSYDGAAYSETLGAMLYFGLISVAGGAGGTISSDTFSIRTSDGKWVQTTDPDYLGAGYSALCVAKDSQGRFYVPGSQHIRRFAPGSGWTTIANDGALNWTGLGAMVCDTTRDRLLRVGDYQTMKFILIETSNGAVTDVTSSLTGSPTDVAAVKNIAVVGEGDGLSVCYSAAIDRYIVKTIDGGAYYTIHPTTWAVALVSPGGAVEDQNGPRPGHLKPIDLYGGLLYNANGADNFWYLKL